MMQRISDKLTNFLIKKNIVRNDDREIYIYGLLAMFSTVINFFLILFIGLVAGLLFETLIYLFGFALLRCYCGGYHAKTQLGCVLSFTAIYALSMAAYYFLPAEYNRLFSMISAGACLIFIFIFAPIEHKNRSFEGNEYKKFRLVSRIIALMYGFMIYSISIFFNQFIKVAIVLSLVMISVSFVLALALVLNERSEYND
jgi:accessory gene regulator B